MIVITGAYGFIGSCLASRFNLMGHDNLVLVDDFSKSEKVNNLMGIICLHEIERSEFMVWFKENAEDVEWVFHIGARTDTTETDQEIFNELNLNYTKAIWDICTDYDIPLVYASSAATYGLGEHGFKDDHDIVDKLEPLNAYGVSKNDFDKWALKQGKTPPNWYGLKFFNVYGPNEYHKGRMASVAYHAFNQIKETGKMQLFKSHRYEYGDGEQLRDFIFVDDVLSVILFLKFNLPESGLYNVGTGKARTFYDLATAIFKTMGLDTTIEFIDTPKDIRDKYQYYTQADMHKLVAAGYNQPFIKLENGINDYIANYLSKYSYY